MIDSKIKELMEKPKLFMPKDLFEKYTGNFIMEFSRNYNINVDYMNKCLCEIEDGEIIKSDIIMAHPHGNTDSKEKIEECYERIREVVYYNPENQFYIFAMGPSNGLERKSGIGRFHNLDYIGGSNFEEKLNGLKDRLSLEVM